MPHPIQSMKFTTDPRSGACRSEDGQYSLTVDRDDNVQVHDASGKPIGVEWAMPHKPVRIDGFFIDPLTGDALGEGGRFGLSRGPGGLIHAFDRFGNRSKTGASDVVAPYVARATAPDATLARLVPGIADLAVEWFVRSWDGSILTCESSLDMMSPHGEHSKEAPYLIVRSAGMTVVSNHGSATRSNGIFCIVMDTGGDIHVCSLDKGPTGADVESFVRELHASHFGKGSRRALEHDGFVEKALDALSRGLADGLATD